MNKVSGKQVAAEDLMYRLKAAKNTEKSALLGFDACIDTLVSVVKNRNENASAEYFSGTAELGSFLMQLGSRSCGLELKTKVSRPGGNMVITAHALGRMGVKADCIGTFGYPEITPVFKALSHECNLHSVADTITATALEFDVSKVIMFDPGPYNDLQWKTITDIIGIDELRRMVSGKKLISFLNWSEIEHSTDIWRHFLDEIFSDLPHDNYRIFFTDFSDCSRKSVSAIAEAIETLGMYRKIFRVVLSLNVNESLLVAGALGVNVNQKDEAFVRAMHEACNVDTVLIHRINDSIAFDGREYVICDTFLSKQPKILTGGGDNFNAGFCYSTFLGTGLFSSVLLANAVAGFYVREGHSPDIDELVSFLSEV